MRYSIRTITATSSIAQALSTEDAKAHMRVAFDDDDSDIEAKCKAAQEALEKHMARCLSPRELELTLDGFPWLARAIDLRRAGVTAILSVKYTDSGGDEITLDAGAYQWSASDEELLLPAFSHEWPSDVAKCSPGAVRIRFSLGYADGEIPPSLVEALKRMTAYLYENREAAGEIPPGVQRLCAGFRRHPNGSVQ